MNASSLAQVWLSRVKVAQLIKLVQEMWAEEPTQRPLMSEVVDRLEHIIPSTSHDTTSHAPRPLRQTLEHRFIGTRVLAEGAADQLREHAMQQVQVACELEKRAQGIRTYLQDLDHLAAEDRLDDILDTKRPHNDTPIEQGSTEGLSWASETNFNTGARERGTNFTLALDDLQRAITAIDPQLEKSYEVDEELLGHSHNMLTCLQWLLSSVPAISLPPLPDVSPSTLSPHPLS